MESMIKTFYLYFMEKCLQCSNVLIHTIGRREKTFCNETCRSNYWYAKNKKGKPKVQDLTKQSKGTTQDLTQKPPQTNYVAEVKPEFSEYQIQVMKERIEVLEKEISNPPPSPMIGKAKWIEIRKKEIADLKNKLP